MKHHIHLVRRIQQLVVAPPGAYRTVYQHGTEIELAPVHLLAVVREDRFTCFKANCSVREVPSYLDGNDLKVMVEQFGEEREVVQEIMTVRLTDCGWDFDDLDGPSFKGWQEQVSEGVWLPELEAIVTVPAPKDGP